jgi:hypothetical protein
MFLISVVGGRRRTRGNDAGGKRDEKPEAHWLR